MLGDLIMKNSKISSSKGGGELLKLYIDILDFEKYGKRCMKIFSFWRTLYRSLAIKKNTSFSKVSYLSFLLQKTIYSSLKLRNIWGKVEKFLSFIESILRKSKRKYKCFLFLEGYSRPFARELHIDISDRDK